MFRTIPDVAMHCYATFRTVLARMDVKAPPQPNLTVIQHIIVSCTYVPSIPYANHSFQQEMGHDVTEWNAATC